MQKDTIFTVEKMVKAVVNNIKIQKVILELKIDTLYISYQDTSNKISNYLLVDDVLVTVSGPTLCGSFPRRGCLRIDYNDLGKRRLQFSFRAIGEQGGIFKLRNGVLIAEVRYYTDH